MRGACMLTERLGVRRGRAYLGVRGLVMMPGGNARCPPWPWPRMEDVGEGWGALGIMGPAPLTAAVNAVIETRGLAWRMRLRLGTAGPMGVQPAGCSLFLPAYLPSSRHAAVKHVA